MWENTAPNKHRRRERALFHRLIEGQGRTYPYFSTRQSTFFKINMMEISEKSKSTSVFQATDPDQPEISTSRMARRRKWLGRDKRTTAGSQAIDPYPP